MIKTRILHCMVCEQETPTRTQKGECPACNLNKARRCSHWEMVFCVIGRTVYARCCACDVQAAVCLDGNQLFTTNGAKMAITHMVEGKAIPA